MMTEVLGLLQMDITITGLVVDLAFVFQVLL